MTSNAAKPGAEKSAGRVALVALHAGYSHSSPALHSIQAFSADQPYSAHMRCFEALLNTNHQALLEALVAFNPVLIGFSTYLWNVQASLRLADLLKQLLPACRIVFGGPEAGPRGRELLQSQRAVDFVITGEGEAAFRDLARWTLYREGELERIAGLCFRRQDRVVVNPMRVLTVEEIPSTISMGLANFDKPLVYWETSRGCPFECEFCDVIMYLGRKQRHKEPDQVIAELDVLYEIGYRMIFLSDDNFTVYRRRAKELLTALAEWNNTRKQGRVMFSTQLSIDAAADHGVPPEAFEDKQAFTQYMKKIRSAYVELARESVNCMTLQPPNSILRGQEVFDKYDSRLPDTERRSALNPARVAALFAVHQAELDILRQVFAISAARTSSGFPATFEEAQSRLGDEPLTSPFDGSRYEYQQLEEGKGFSLKVREAKIGDIDLPGINFQFFQSDAAE